MPPEPTESSQGQSSRSRTTARVAGGASGRGQSLRDKAASLTQGNALLIVLLAIAGGVLYWISRPKVPEKADAGTQTAKLRVNAALTHLGSGKVQPNAEDTDVEALVGAFYEQAKDRQIPVGQLGTNPFVHVMKEAPAPPPPPPVAPTTRPVVTKVPDVSDLSLKTVLIGVKRNSAMIATGAGTPEIVTEGQEINGWTVEKIQPRKVVLRFRDRTHELLLPE